MPYILLNYYENEERETACRPQMKSETAEELHAETIKFIKDGHHPYIMSLIHRVSCGYSTDSRMDAESQVPPTCSHRIIQTESETPHL